MTDRTEEKEREREEGCWIDAISRLHHPYRPNFLHQATDELWLYSLAGTAPLRHFDRA